MKLPAFRFILVLFGLILIISAATLSIHHNNEFPPYAMIVNSNIRDYDQAFYLMTPDGHIIKRLTALPGNERMIALSPDDRWILVKSDVDHNYYTINIRTSQLWKVADLRGQAIQISPDSRWIYFDSGQQPRNVRVSMDGTVRQEISPDGQFTGLSFDGAWSYINGPPIRRINMNTGEVQSFPSDDFSWDSFWLYTGESPHYVTNNLSDVNHWIDRLGDDPWIVLVGNLQFSGSSNQFIAIRSDLIEDWPFFSPPNQYTARIIFSPYDDQLYVNRNKNFYRLNPDNTVNELLIERIGDGFAGWTNDPDWVLFIFQDIGGPANLVRVHLTTGERQILVPEILFAPHNLSPRGSKILVSLNPSNPPSGYYLIDSDGQNRRDIPQELNMVFRAWSPDDEWLYFDKFGVDSSELFRINTHTGERQTVHRPAFDNNRFPIFAIWITIPQQSWHIWQTILIGIFSLCMPLIISFADRLSHLIQPKVRYP
jgi:Tol biopolymer transport system component